MQLDKQQKEDLKNLTEHRGFKVFEALYEDKRLSLYSEFDAIPLKWEVQLDAIRERQWFNLGMKYLIETAKGKAQEVVKAPDMH